MLDFIIKYWVQFLFGLLTTGGLTLIKHYQKLYKDEKTRQAHKWHTELVEEVRTLINTVEEKSNESDAKMQGQIDTLRAGVLSLQGKQFRDSCETLLQQDTISFEEFEEITHEWDVYHNKLGGNHNGDKYYDLIVRKVQSQFSKGAN